jgi:hypothetical protein
LQPAGARQGPGCRGLQTARRAELNTTQQFALIKRRCFDLIREESFKAMNSETTAVRAVPLKESDCEPKSAPQDYEKTEAMAQSSSESGRIAALFWRN